MSLVAYGSSDDESEDEDSKNLEVLSAPKARMPVKISIPSLKDFNEDGEQEKVTKVKPKSGSGLFSLLPPPKNSLPSKPGFTPYVFSKKKEQVQPKLRKPKPNEQIDSSIEKKEPIIEGSDDLEDPDISSEKVDFFSLEDKSKPFEISSEKTDFFSLQSTKIDPVTSDSKENVSYSSSTSFLSNPDTISPAAHISEASTSDEVSISASTNFSLASGTTDYYSQDIALPVSETSVQDWNTTSIKEGTETDLLKDEGFIKLKGKRSAEEINIIDINADDQLTGREEWLMRSLTEEATHRPSKRRHDMPTQQQRRKHQITYLAFQAKEREMDLKNQWAHNNRTRRETQAKYGF